MDRCLRSLIPGVYAVSATLPRGLCPTYYPTPAGELQQHLLVTLPGTTFNATLPYVLYRLTPPVQFPLLLWLKTGLYP